MKKVSKIIITSLIITITLSIIFFLNKKEVKHNGTFAIMLETSKGTGRYENAKDNRWPQSDEYVINMYKTYCEKGSVLRWNNETKKINATVKGTDKCYVYFDFKEPNMVTFEKDNPNTLTKDLVGDMYRFYSSEANNYICFGTEEKCASNSEYMYRIIGVSAKDELKLMKNTTIGSYEYTEDASKEACGENAENCIWGKNTLSIGLNGEYFLTNPKYEYLQNDMWLNLIEDKKWNVGKVPQAVNGNILNLEKTMVTEETLKIGIPYLSDVFIGYDGTDTKLCDAKNCMSWWPKSTFLLLDLSFFGDYGTIKNIWMAWVWNNRENDAVSYYPLSQRKIDIFPVFYTKSVLTIASGTGTESNPYIIDLEKTNQYLQ